MVPLTIQTDESFASDFGKHKFNKLFQYCTQKLKATSLVIKDMHLQAIHSQFYQFRIGAKETQYKGYECFCEALNQRRIR